MCLLGLSENSFLEVKVGVLLKASWDAVQPWGQGHWVSYRQWGASWRSAPGAAPLPEQQGCPHLGLLETLETSALSKLGKHNPCALGLPLGALPG